MKKMTLSLCFALLAACAAKHDGAPLSSNSESRIFGGPTAYGSQYGSYAAVLLTTTATGDLTCTATPILPTFMLVSAHCLKNAKPVKVLFFMNQVARNILDTWPAEKTRTIKQVIVHPRAGIKVPSDHGNPYDIALLQLNEPMPEGMKTFVLSSAPLNPRTTPDVGIVGYGFEKVIRLSDGTLAPQGKELFRFATQPVLPGGDAGMFLLDGHQGQGTCAGDSGGPIFLTMKDGRFLLVGLTTTRLTYNTQADQCEVNSLAVDISYQLNWILSTIRYLQPSS